MTTSHHVLTNPHVGMSQTLVLHFSFGRNSRKHELSWRRHSKVIIIVVRFQWILHACKVGICPECRPALRFCCAFVSWQTKFWGPNMDFGLVKLIVFPESVWAKGSSKSGGLLYIFTCSHSSHLHILTSAHVHILTSPRLHIFAPSYLHMLTSHIFSSSHLHIFSLSLFLFLFLFLFLSVPVSVSFSVSFSFSLSLCLSLSLLPSVMVSLLLFLFTLEAAGSADEAPRYGHPFARNEVRVSKTDGILRV